MTIDERYKNFLKEYIKDFKNELRMHLIKNRPNKDKIEYFKNIAKEFHEIKRYLIKKGEDEKAKNE